MKKISKKDLKKTLKFCGGLKGFAKVHRSYSEHRWSPFSDSDWYDCLSDVSIKRRTIAVINKVILSKHDSFMSYISVFIDGNRYSFIIFDDDIDRLLKGVSDIGDSYEIALEKCKGQLCSFSVYYGIVQNLQLIEYSDFSEVEDLLFKSHQFMFKGDKIIRSKKRRKNSCNNIGNSYDYDFADTLICYSSSSAKKDLQTDKFEYFGGLEKFMGLYNSYKKYMLDALYVYRARLRGFVYERLSDITLGDSLAIIIAIKEVADFAYIEILIDEEIYLLKLSEDELGKLLTGTTHEYYNFDDMLNLFFGQPCFVTVSNGYANDIKLIDFRTYKEAVNCIPKKWVKIKEEQ